jgi:hypothetical protein
MARRKYPKANYLSHGGKRIFRSSFDRFMDEFNKPLFKKEDAPWRNDSPQNRPAMTPLRSKH